jgi:predicted acyl esterase
MLRGLGGSLAAIALALALAGSATAAEPSFNARGSVEQVYATGLPEETNPEVSLLDSSNQVVETRNANDLGGVLFRNVPPGDDYSVRLETTGETAGPLTVMTTQSAPPSAEVHDQQIDPDGYGYLTTRDGIELAYSVHPPTDLKNVPAGLLGQEGEPFDPPPNPQPAPTLIEYSGYGYANPEGPQSGIATLANLMGFTVVDVNMRGTGCSGGAFDFFEPLQSLDGYDVIETVANQPWVKGGKVGMLGISYGGISQLFTAQTQPPSLAAITPLSVIDKPQTTLYPGGILNTGFAFPWAQERQREANPADPNDPDNGAQEWAVKRVAEGDQDCKDNQVLHPEAVDLIQKVRDNNHYVPEIADPLSPDTFVDKINVPTFMACQWTDEQTGGHCPTLADKILSGPHPKQKWFTFTNGTHIDSLSPEIYNRLYDFLQIYVAEEPPINDAALVHASAPAVYAAAFGINGVLLPPDPIQLQPTHELAKEAFEAQPPVRVLFDNGAGQPLAGYPYPGFERSFSDWPVPETAARPWYLAPDGALAEQSPADAAADAFTWDAGARPLTDFTGNTGTGGLWGATPDYQWSQDPDRGAVAYVTEPMSEDAAVVGPGRVDVWVRSSVPNVDLQATISEVRPDGKETFVQNGWIRTLARELDEAKSTELAPVPSFRQEDFEPMPTDRFEKVTIPLYYEGHVYRAGSRIRVRISAPNGDQPIWSFGETEPAGPAEIEIGYGGELPSRLLLPVIPGVSAESGLPPCPALRGQPCRDYQPFENAAGGPVEQADPPTQGGPPAQGGPPPSQGTPAPPAVGQRPAPRVKRKRCKKVKKRGAKKRTGAKKRAAAAKKKRAGAKKKKRCSKKKKKKR